MFNVNLEDSRSSLKDFESLSAAKIADVMIVEEKEGSFFTVFNGSYDLDSYKRKLTEMYDWSIERHNERMLMLGAHHEHYYHHLEKRINECMNCFTIEDGKILHRNIRYFTSHNREIEKEDVPEEALELIAQFIRVQYDVLQSFAVRILENRKLPLGTVTIWQGMDNELLEMIDALVLCKFVTFLPGMTKEAFFQQCFRFNGKELPPDFESRLNKIHERHNPFHFLEKLLQAYQDFINNH